MRTVEKRRPGTPLVKLSPFLPSCCLCVIDLRLLLLLLLFLLSCIACSVASCLSHYSQQGLSLLDETRQDKKTQTKTTLLSRLARLEFIRIALFRIESYLHSSFFIFTISSYSFFPSSSSSRPVSVDYRSSCLLPQSRLLSHNSTSINR